MQTLKQNSIFAKSVDIIYEFSKNEIERQGIKTLEKIYQNTSWIDSYKMDFYKTKENHKKHIEDALKGFLEDYNLDDYIYCELSNLPFDPDFLPSLGRGFCIRCRWSRVQPLLRIVTDDRPTLTRAPVHWISTSCPVPHASSPLWSAS